MTPDPGKIVQEGAEPVTSVEDLVAFVRSGEKPPEAWRVGTEHEKIGVFVATGERVPYEGECGIGAVLARIAALEGWNPVTEAGNIIAVERDGASITLEPGGQLELSGAPFRTLHETCEEFHAHIDMMKRVSDPCGVAWLGLGMDPLHAVEDVPRMPKERYRIMRRVLPERGALAMQMMHLTATVQANLDYRDESDMVEKMRISMGLSPVLSAIFANSSLSEGKANGLASRRVQIWRDVDPDRCGLLDFVFDPDFSYRRYVDWALDVPLIFITRGERYLELGGKTFRTFLAEGHDGHPPLLSDWRTHLATLFPEVRLKNVIEVRGVDAVPAGLVCSMPALCKGFLYDSEARRAAWELVSHWDAETRRESLDAAAERGLESRMGGRPALAIARDLLSVASEGLRRIGHPGPRDPDERGFLEPIHEQLETGRSPGERVRELWEGEWQRSQERLIEYARY